MNAEEHLWEFEKMYAYPDWWKQEEAVKHLKIALQDLQDFAKGPQRERIDKFVKESDGDPYLLHLLAHRLLRISTRKAGEKTTLGI